MGSPPGQTRARVPAIEAFAEIGRFVDQPVKMYSSGKLVRLAFAAAIHVDPDVLRVDEALAVGDAIFQHRCMRRIKELQDQGKTIPFVSNDIGMVKALCSEVLLIDAGEVRGIGDPSDVANLYHVHLAGLETRRAELTEPVLWIPVTPTSGVFRADPTFDRRAGFFRYGTGAARIRDVELLGGQLRPLAAADFNQEIVLRGHVEFYEDVPTCNLGYLVRDKTGTNMIGTNT